MTRALPCLLTLLVLGACASAPVREPPAPLVEFKPDVAIREVWSARVGGETKDWVGLVPKISDGTLYVAGPQGQVHALVLESGRSVWQTELKDKIGGAVGIGEGLVLLGTRRGEVIALDRTSGKLVWRAPVSSEVLAAPAAGGGVVVVQTVDGRLFGLSATDGKRLWVDQRTEPALSLRGTSVPMIAGAVVVAGFANGKLAALDLHSGRARWEATVGQPRGRNEIERLVDVDAASLIMTDAIYASSYQGRLVALNPVNGSIGWSRDVSSYTGIAGDGNNVYVTDAAGRVLAFDRRTGASLWKQEALRGRSLNAPVVYRDYVVVADYQGYVHWLARADGRFVARHQAGSDPVRAPAMTDGDLLLVLGQSGNLVAVRPDPK